MKARLAITDRAASDFSSLLPKTIRLYLSYSFFGAPEAGAKNLFGLNAKRLLLSTIAVLPLAETGLAQSSLRPESTRELQTLLATQAPATVRYSKVPPYTPIDTRDRFLMWNEVALETTAIDHTPVTSGEDPRRFGEQFGPARTSYALAIVHIAMFDAVNAISKRYFSYTGLPSVSGDVSMDSAIAQAAHDTLVALYPFQEDRDAIFELDISAILGSPASTHRGAHLGKEAAKAILALRKNDGSEMPEPIVGVDFFTINQPGYWQIDPVSNIKVALGGNWSHVKPFVMASAHQFRAATPPSITSDIYKQNYQQVYKYGGDPEHGTSTARTAQLTYIAKFWSYDGTPSLCAPPRLYNQVVRAIANQQKMRKVPELSRLFALANVAMADAGISAWEAKYYYQYWRPVTGIRNAPSNANSTWYPLGAQDTNTKGPNFTPPFPSYPSGHATFGGALFEILRKFWPDATPFTVVSDEFNGENKDVDGYIRPLMPMTFSSFSEAEQQNAESRIYMGVHWQFDADFGIKEGEAVGDYVFSHSFQPASNDAIARPR